MIVVPPAIHDVGIAVAGQPELDPLTKVLNADIVDQPGTGIDPARRPGFAGIKFGINSVVLFRLCGVSPILTFDIVVSRGHVRKDQIARFGRIKPVWFPRAGQPHDRCACLTRFRGVMESDIPIAFPTPAIEIDQDMVADLFTVMHSRRRTVPTLRGISGRSGPIAVIFPDIL